MRDKNSRSNTPPVKGNFCQLFWAPDSAWSSGYRQTPSSQREEPAPQATPLSCCVSTHTFHCAPSAATRALKSPLSFKNPQVGVHKAQVNLYVGVWFREARRGCSSSYADRIYSTPSHERCSVPFVLFLIFIRGKDLKKDISAQPNSQLHISVLSPEMNRMQWCELLQ